MILADTSVWIDHLRRADDQLSNLLNRQQVLAHPFVIGELALGSLKARSAFLRELENLPSAIVARDAEVMRFIDDNRLFGKGVGYVDAHLLAATRLTAGTTFWTRDKRLSDVAKDLLLAAPP